MSEGFVTTASMTNAILSLESLTSADLLSATRELVRKSHCVEADLLAHIGEIDDRKLYLDCAHPSMFAFCLDELGFSECAAYNRITVARIGRRLPAVIEAVRAGKVHLAGLRVLAPHLTVENHEVLLAHAAGKSKRDIEEMVARLWPLPPVPTSIRRVLENPILKSPATPASRTVWGSADPPAFPDEPRSASPSTDHESADVAMRREAHRPIIAPLSGETFRIQFTATRACRDVLQEAQDLLRHRVPDGDLSTIIERALRLLVDDVKKERFAVGRKPRSQAAGTAHKEEAPETAVPSESVETPKTAEELAPADKLQPAENLHSAENSQVVPNPQTAGNPQTPRNAEAAELAGAVKAASRHIPDAIKRAVFERDEGQCTFVDERGRRCSATDALTFEHVEGFARTRTHTVGGIRLLCRAHNQHAADQMYGREFMEQARAGREPPATRPGAS
jgi:5-methylcytosine-specific restriction endonuclease McrA